MHMDDPIQRLLTAAGLVVMKLHDHPTEAVRRFGGAVWVRELAAAMVKARLHLATKDTPEPPKGKLTHTLDDLHDAPEIKDHNVISNALSGGPNLDANLPRGEEASHFVHPPEAERDLLAELFASVAALLKNTPTP
jgi:hypothetical protein